MTKSSKLSPGQSKAASPLSFKTPLVMPSGYPRFVKRMIAHQIERELVRQDISRVQLARLMKTSRAAVNRLLDPNNKSVTLQTLERAAEILGKQLQVFFHD